MRVIIVKDAKQLGKVSAGLIAAEMQKKPTFVLGLATGTSPIPLYQELIRLNRSKTLDFSTAITFNLDEYVGLKPTHAQSYRYFMNRAALQPRQHQQEEHARAGRHGQGHRGVLRGVRVHDRRRRRD